MHPLKPDMFSKRKCRCSSAELYSRGSTEEAPEIGAGVLEVLQQT